jgi:hypothetical protein
MAQSAGEVTAKIKDAFAKTPKPSDDELVGSHEGDPECTEVARAFRAQRWTDLSREMLRDHSQALPLFTPSAFRHYLPAYMMACLGSREEAEVLRDFVIFNLTPPRRSAGWRADFFRARATQFSPEERDAIKCFLELMEERRVIDWKSQGLDPPPSRIKGAIDYWALLQSVTRER